ncbi:MAG: TPM domain-containing protein [Verrucomicrobiaceae bacterium]|nr:TPM domain-containing protein [Verrucomicrobiaceae bacterium]
MAPSIRGIAICLAVLASWWANAADALPPKPAAYINDYASVMDSVSVQRLNSKLESFERESSNQIVVALFPKLPDNTYLEDFTVKTAQAWAVGRKQQDNGIVFFAFVTDRKMRIEVGYGLEGRVPDSVADSIIRNEIRPAFKAGNYTLGVERAIDSLIAATRGEYQGTGKTTHEEKNEGIVIPGWLALCLIILFLIWIHTGDTMFQRGGRVVVHTGLDLLRIVLSSSGGSSGGGGGGWSSSSGGFSGGGGSFGGGGASGDW